MIKTYYDQIIVELLKQKPGECYITPDGTALYVLGPDDQIFEFTGPNFNDLDDDAVNQFIVKILTPLID